MEIVRSVVGFRGLTGNIDLSSVTLETGAPGSGVTYSNGVLTIPRGDVGPQGEAGIVDTSQFYSKNEIDNLLNDLIVRLELLEGGSPPAATAPTVTTQPSITGGATTGSVLTLSEGAASGTPAPTSAVQWLRGTTAISGATGATYTTVAADEGNAVSAHVTWTNSAGSVQAASNAITVQAPAATPAPAATTAPSVNPTAAQVGGAVTLTLGTWSNATSVTGKLMQGDVDRTSEIVDQVWSPSVAGDFEWIVTASGPGGTTEHPAISGTVMAAALDLNAVAQVYHDFAATYPGSDQPVTSLTLGGTLGLTAAEATAGGDAPATWTPAGLVLTGLDLLRVTTMTGGMVEDALILMDWTPAAPSTGTYTPVALMTASTVKQTLAISSGGFAFSPATNVLFDALSGVGIRRVYGGYVERVAGRVTHVRSDGYIGADALESYAATGAFDWTRLEIGKGASGTIHRLLVMVRRTGEAWPADPQTVIDRFSNRTRPVMSGGWQVFQTDGQSLALGYNPDTTLALKINRLGRDGVKMLAGLKSSTGGAINIDGPKNTGYNTTVPATAVVPAQATTVVPPGMLTAIALTMHRARLGLPNPRLVVGFNGMAGQPVEHFDNDSPAVTGSLGTALYENRGYWGSEVKRLLPSVVAADQGWCQGEANLIDAAGVYTSKATETFGDQDAQDAAIFGTSPRRGIYQSNGYANSTTRQPGVARLEQVALAKQPGRFLIGPLYPYPTTDGIHPSTLVGCRFAELHALAIVTQESGGDWSVLEPKLTLGSGTFTLTFARPVANEAGHYADYGGDPAHYGLEAVGGGAITAAALSADGLTITGTTTGAVTGVQGAMQSADMGGAKDADGQVMAATRMTLRERDWGQESLLLRALGYPGVILRRWVPAFRVMV